MALARGSVPHGKIEPNIMYKDDREFTPKWIQKLTTAEQDLAATIMEHLTKLIKKCDSHIRKLTSESLATMKRLDPANAITHFRETLTMANEERLK